MKSCNLDFYHYCNHKFNFVDRFFSICLLVCVWDVPVLFGISHRWCFGVSHYTLHFTLLFRCGCNRRIMASIWWEWKTCFRNTASWSRTLPSLGHEWKPSMHKRSTLLMLNLQKCKVCSHSNLCSLVSYCCHNCYWCCCVYRARFCISLCAMFVKPLPYFTLSAAVLNFSISVW